MSTINEVEDEVFGFVAKSVKVDEAIEIVTVPLKSYDGGE